MKNAKAFYEDNKDQAEVAYSWFAARIKAFYENQGKDEDYLFRSSSHYILDPKQAVFKEMLKRGWVGEWIDGHTKVKDIK